MVVFEIVGGLIVLALIGVGIAAAIRKIEEGQEAKEKLESLTKEKRK